MVRLWGATAHSVRMRPTAPTAPTAPRRFPWEVTALAESWEGVSEDELYRAVSDALDQVYGLRALFGWASTRLSKATEYKSFSRSRRPFAEKQIELLARAARGDATKVLAERGQYVRNAARNEGAPETLKDIIPDLVPAGHDSSSELRITVALAYVELLALRQLAAYEAGVARVHDIPSGPKAVRSILTDIDAHLLVAAAGPLSPWPASLGDVNMKASLHAVGAGDTLTTWSFCQEHGL